MGAQRLPIEYDAASPEVRAVYDEIMATRRVAPNRLATGYDVPVDARFTET